MAKRDVKGLNKVTSKKGRGRVYWYAWRGRGAPQVQGEYGTPEFWASYDAAIRERHVPEPGKFRALVTLYRASADYAKLAASTKRQWGPWLDRIAACFDLSIAAFDNPKVRPIIRQWRNKYADTPRTADMGTQVLSRVCGYAVEQGKLTVNPCEGIKALYSADRSAIIWTDADIASIKQAGIAELGHAVDLAALTGLRRGDLLRLSWPHVHENEIVIPTNKSGRRVEARIPIYADLRAVLARIPKRSTTVLTNSFGRPWKTGDGLGTAFIRAKAKAGIGDDLHFHDLRGTAATKFYAAGLPLRVIAEILGWTEGSVDSIIRKYVDRTAATKAVIRLLDKRAE
jgi:integrase